MFHISMAHPRSVSQIVIHLEERKKKRSKHVRTDPNHPFNSLAYSPIVVVIPASSLSPNRPTSLALFGSGLLRETKTFDFYSGPDNLISIPIQFSVLTLQVHYPKRIRHDESSLIREPIS